jgi:hypothetical protein
MKNGRLTCLLIGLTFALTGTVWASEDTSGMQMEHRLDLSYRGVKEGGNTGRAAEYRDLHFGPGVELEFKGLSDAAHIFIDGKFETKNDYNLDAHLDLPGAFKLNLASERLWHNLDHIPYDQSLPESRQDGITGIDPTFVTPPKTRVIFEEQNPDDEYGIRVERDTAEAIIKLGNYPGHVKLKYWRWEKKGQKQLRFVDEGHEDGSNPFFACNSCHMQSKTRKIDRVTQEVTGSVDAHVGFFDISLEQLFRIFKVKDPIPVDNFSGHLYGPTGGADFQHSEDPESQLFQSTAKIRTALSGGVVADAAYSYGRRENKTELADRPLGVEGAYAISEYDKVAGNFSYTPTQNITANVRFRFLDLDTTNSDTISADYNVVDKIYPVRDNIDIRRAVYSGSIAWRPDYSLTIKGDYDHEVVQRSNTGGPMEHHGSTAAIADGGEIDTVWELPEENVIDTLRLTLTSRPLRKSDLKLKAWYRYVTQSDPAYGATAESRHEAFISSHYAPRKSNWGLSLSARGQRDTNEIIKHSVWDSVLTDPGPPAVYDNTAVILSSDRKRNLQSYNLGAWMSPLSTISTGFNYGYSKTEITQDILFGASDLFSTTAGFYNIDAESKYLQDSHSCSLYTTIQMAKQVTLRFDGYLTLSSSKFTPESFYYVYGTDIIDPNAVSGLIASSEGINEVSRLDFIQQGLSAGIDWQPAEQLTVSLKYAVDQYRSRNTDFYDGTAQTGAVSVSRTW